LKDTRTVFLALLLTLNLTAVQRAMSDAPEASSTLTPRMRSHIDAAVTSALARQRVPAASLAIVINGQVAYAKGYGARNLSSGSNATVDTIYPIGSNTKQFTAAAILLLQEKGKLSIQDLVSKYVPSAPHGSDITIAQLLEHVSGLPDYTQTPEFAKNSADSVTPDEILATIRGMPLAFKPGTSWQYSNTNYFLLSLVTAKTSGESYQTFIHENLLAPLNLSSAVFGSTSQMLAQEARGYSSFAMGDFHDAPSTDYTWFQGAGDLVMSATDLARWDAALDSGKVISSESFHAMSTPKTLPDGTSADYGFGLSAGNSFLGHAIVGHLGGFAGFVSEDITIPADRVAVVLLSNSDSFNPVPVVHDIIATIYNQPLPHHQPRALLQSDIESAEAREWLQYALTGAIDSKNAAPDFMAWLMPTPTAQKSVTADLKALGHRLGRPESFQLVSREGPPGVKAFEYHVTFADEVVDFQYAVTPSGTLDYLAFAPVYDY
jgi:D-alanyl-D-alanine carboxypeptidase